MMKIVHLIFSLNLGGAEAMLVDIINQQAFLDKVFLYVINKAYNKDLLVTVSNKVEVILLNRKPSSRNIIDLFRLNIYLYKNQPDIVHCHDSNIIKYILFPSRYHTVLTVHDTRLPLKGLKKFQDIIAISTSVEKMLKTRGAKNTCTIYNGINIDKILKKEKMILWGPHIRVVQVSRLEHEKKGQHLVIEALHIIKNTIPDLLIEVDFIGSGSSEDYLKKLAKEFGVSDRIHFLAMRNRGFVYAHLKNYDILLQPSFYEGFGLTVVEGMAAGLPVLVSNIEGPMEIIQQGKYGYYFQVGNVDDLVSQLLFMLKNPLEVSSMAQKGQVHAIAHFDIAKLVFEYSELYKKRM